MQSVKRSVFVTLLSLGITTIALSQTNEVDNPEKNFDKLWAVFENRYANFELKGVDWNKIYLKYRALITSKTTNGNLFELSCAMLQELNDGHVTIQPNFNEDEDIECGPPYDFTIDAEFDNDDRVQQFEALVNQELKAKGFSEPIKTYLTDDTNFQYRLSETFGYLRLDEMTEKITFGKFKKAVDESVKAFKDKQGVIIDLRFNGGGWDKNAYLLASRLIPQGETTGHFERTRIKGTNKYTKMKYREIAARGKSQFTKPIVILTSDFTASAAEVFVLVLKDLTNVVTIGDNTEGIFSDMYEFKLPNGWEVSLSHQQFFSKSKENYEGKGITPYIKVINKREDLASQTDPVIRAALDYLSSKK